MSTIDADGIANSEDPEQTAPLGAVWSGSALFAQTCLSENFNRKWICWTLSLLESSADNLFKLFGPNLLGLIWVQTFWRCDNIPVSFFKQVSFGKSPQTTKKQANLPSM